MKKVLLPVLFALALVFTSEATAQKFSGMDKSPADIASFPTSYKESNKIVRVVYSRPQLNNRTPFVADTELGKLGKVWRTGANEAPEVTLYKDVTFGGEKVAAGTYALFTIPGEGEWTVILNKNLNQWGAYSYDNAADVVRVTSKALTDGESLEAFSMTFKEVDGGAHLVMGWGTTRVATPIMF